MRVLMVVESCFGNTESVAQAVASSLRRAGAEVEQVDAHAAPTRPLADLILVGAPTHSLGLPTSATRSQAASKGAPQVPSGVREWIAGVEAVTAPVITFSTKVKGVFSGSAGKAAVTQLRRRGVDARRGEDFVVGGVDGPLADGELERAGRWAATLLPRPDPTG